MCCYIYGVWKTTLVIWFSSYIGPRCLVFLQVILVEVVMHYEVSISQYGCIFLKVRSTWGLLLYYKNSMAFDFVIYVKALMASVKLN